MRATRAANTALQPALTALVFAILLVFGGGTALAFPTGITGISSVNVISGAEQEQIHVGGSTVPIGVYMGPYKITGANFVEYMMCFNAAASAKPADYALATNTSGAIALFGSEYKEKLNMIAWLASQWDFSQPLAAEKNADINKAMWEIMADYDKSDVVDGNLSAKSGSFYLNAGDADISEVDQLLGQALGYASIYTEANFLIPLTTGGAYDIAKQPFVQPVPEPDTLLLLGSGLIGLGLFGWRKRARAKR